MPKEKQHSSTPPHAFRTADPQKRLPGGQRGAPRKDGEQPGWMLSRVDVVCWAYETARVAGKTHSSAIYCAVKEVKKLSIEMPISESTVEKILTEFYSKSSPWVMRVERNGRHLIVRFGERPEFEKKRRLQFHYGNKPK